MKCTGQTCLPTEAARADFLLQGEAVMTADQSFMTPFATSLTGAVRIEAERGIFRSLLRVGSSDPASALRAVLGQVISITGCERAYLEVPHPLTQERWTLQRGCSGDEEAAIRRRTSRGIVAEAISSGKTIQSPSALLDSRFNQRDSIQAQRLEAVLCVPVPSEPPGVFYLEGHRGARGFSDDDIALVEEVARAVSPVLMQAATFQGLTQDATAEVRARMCLRCEGLIGRSPALAVVLRQVLNAAAFDATVLLTGETGTGKTQAARAIHDNSARRDGPFIELNCGAIAEANIESELFGTVAGAFSGVSRNQGKFEAANGGTLFLDEVGELSAAAQTRLLQVLQSKQYFPLGSSKAQTANVRLIAATNVDLEQLAEAKRFRTDLLYRINVLPIRMPSLSERPDDIDQLVDVLLERLAVQHGVAPLRASHGVRNECRIRTWKGNVRELRNWLERALLAAVGEGAPQVERRHLRPDALPVPGQLSFHEATRAFQRDFLKAQLEATEWNISEVARQLELTRSHVYNLIRSLGVERPSTPGEATHEHH
jgi:Nif-specific regulatory protein